MKILPIVWQRLVTKDGKTCERCGNTHLEILRAVEVLSEKLIPQGIHPVLRTKIISEQEFKEHPLESNKILICGRLLEEWLDAQTGASSCCDACGDEACRTLTLGDDVFEAIPAELIIEAGVKAAHAMRQQ